MSIPLTQDNQRFVDEQVSSGRFKSTGDALNAGIVLLCRRQKVLDCIDEGRRQLDEGEYTDYTEEEMDVYFDELIGRAVEHKREWQDTA